MKSVKNTCKNLLQGTKQMKINRCDASNSLVLTNNPSLKTGLETKIWEAKIKNQFNENKQAFG